VNNFTDLLTFGYADAVNGLIDSYGDNLSKIVKEARKRGIRDIGGATVSQLELLQELDTRTLLGSAKSFSDRLTNELFSGIVSGENISSIVERLSETKLLPHQLNVAVYDSFKQFDDLARYKVFEGADVTWTYDGPFDDKTRDACRKTIENEIEDGPYTEEKAAASGTPFGVRGGFNCRHSWLVYAG